jgi:hypothetical protein
MKSVRILRVDPNRRTVATMFLRAVKDATPQLRKLVRANDIGSREIMQIDGKPLMCIAGLAVDESMKGWRMRGGDDTGGVAVLTGRNEANVLIDVPISREWILSRLEWMDGEDVGERSDRADELIPALNDDIRAALDEAIVLPDGIWISAAHKAIVGEAMVTLGLGTDRSGGQLLTPLGEDVFDKLPGTPVDGPETR